MNHHFLSDGVECVLFFWMFGLEALAWTHFECRLSQKYDKMERHTQLHANIPLILQETGWEPNGFAHKNGKAANVSPVRKLLLSLHFLMIDYRQNIIIISANSFSPFHHFSISLQTI